MMNTTVAISTGVFALVILGFMGYLAWLKPEYRYPRLAAAIQRLLPWVVYWAFWGGVFGAAGAAILMKMAGIPPPEAVGWLIFGAIMGIFWGAIWGLIFGVTER